MVRPGLVSAGEPSGLRRAGCSIFLRSPLAIALVPLPLASCFPNRPLPPVPSTLLPALPVPPVVVVVVLPVVVVVLVVLPAPVPVPVPPEPEPPVPPVPESPPDVGALYSLVPSGPLQPGSPRSTRASPSSSLRFEHPGRTVVVGASTWTPPTVTDV